jgi:NTE family protein
MANLRYKGGMESFLAVLDADRQLFTTQLDLAGVQLDQLLTIVQLYKALGGGWEISSLVDFEHVRHAEGIKLFVVATNVRTGMQKIFRRQEMTVDMVLASACLPFVFQAVEIDGEAFWDGGYMGNPALFPLVDDCQSRDIVIVQINPIYREELPRTAPEILNRINEITFNASLIKEIRAIAILKELINVANLENQRFKDALFHRINADEELKALGVSSKLNTEWAFLKHLHDVGYRTTSDWLDEYYDDLGNRSSLDIESVYLEWKGNNLC